MKHDKAPDRYLEHEVQPSGYEGMPEQLNEYITVAELQVSSSRDRADAQNAATALNRIFIGANKAHTPVRLHADFSKIDTYIQQGSDAEPVPNESAPELLADAVHTGMFYGFDVAEMSDGYELVYVVELPVFDDDDTVKQVSAPTDCSYVEFQKLAKSNSEMYGESIERIEECIGAVYTDELLKPLADLIEGEIDAKKIRKMTQLGLDLLNLPSVSESNDAIGDLEDIFTSLFPAQTRYELHGNEIVTTPEGETPIPTALIARIDNVAVIEDSVGKKAFVFILADDRGMERFFQMSSLAYFDISRPDVDPCEVAREEFLHKYPKIPWSKRTNFAHLADIVGGDGSSDMPRQPRRQ